MNALQQAFPQATVELWTTDQHRVGLKPILRRVWVRKGSRPRVSVHQRYQWLYLYIMYHLARLPGKLHRNRAQKIHNDS
jgi:hypothetical protein